MLSALKANWINLCVVGGIVCFTGCVAHRPSTNQLQRGESVVCVGEEPATLVWPLSARKSDVVVRSTYLTGPDTTTYREGQDFVLDRRAATIRRLPGSRIPDFRTNSLYGQQDFDHSKFPGFGNGGFFAFVDYTFKATAPWPVQAPQDALLPKSLAKLRAGGEFRIVAYGDSITAGGDATKPELIFWRRWTDDLRVKYPTARITIENGATGGDSTVQGLARLRAKVLDRHPDLVLIGFGMNDHNQGGPSIPQFESNLKQMVSQIRETIGAEVILFSAFPPNPKWKFGSHRMGEYAAATERVAGGMGCAFADVFRNWQALASRKKPEDLLGNNINHPNDFGHWIYYRVLADAMSLGR